MQTQVSLTPDGRGIPSDKAGRWIALLFLFIGAFVRCPAILIHGRVWAEELPVFLLTNWNRSFLFALEAQHFGYFSIWDNVIAAMAVHWVPLPLVALLFTWSSLLILLWTGYLVFEAEFLVTRTAKFLAVLALLLTAPSVETWLNMLNTEFYFGIWSLLILFSSSSRLVPQRLFALAVAVLSGPVTTLMAPLFVLRAVARRTRGNIVQALIVCVGGFFQIAIAATSSIAGRQVHPNPVMVAPALFDREIVFLFFSRIGAKGCYLFLRDRMHYSTVALAATWLGLLVGMAVLFFFLRKSKTALYLLFAAFWMATLEAMLGLGGGWELLASGERYSYLPNFILVVALVVVASSVEASYRTAARILLALALCSGAVDYVLLPLRFKLDWEGDSWRQQALRWQVDSSTALHGYPTNWKSYTLPPSN